MEKQTPTLYLYDSKKAEKWSASGIYIGVETNSPTNNELVVFKGSVVKKPNKLYKPQCVNKRIEVESLSKDQGDHYLLEEDVTFSSPSLAAAVMLGKECNGKVLWRTEDGQMLKDIVGSARRKPMKGA